MNRYPKEVNEAIWALHKADKSIAEIARAINEGEAGITLARPIPYETVRAKRRKLILERGDGMSEPLHTETVPDTAEAIAQEFLTLARAKANQIRAATASRSIKPEETLSLERLGRMVNELRKGGGYREARGTKRRGQTSPPDATPSTLLRRLARGQSQARFTSDTQIRSASKVDTHARNGSAQS